MLASDKVKRTRRTDRPMTAPRRRISLALRRYPAQLASHSHAGWHQLVAARRGVLEMDIEARGGNAHGNCWPRRAPVTATWSGSRRRSDLPTAARWRGRFAPASA